MVSGRVPMRPNVVNIAHVSMNDPTSCQEGCSASWNACVAGLGQNVSGAGKAECDNEAQQCLGKCSNAKGQGTCQSKCSGSWNVCVAACQQFSEGGDCKSACDAEASGCLSDCVCVGVFCNFELEISVLSSLMDFI